MDSLGTPTINTAFQIWLGDGVYFGSSPFTLEATGTIASGNRTIPVYNNVSKWNFIPNPFPSTLIWDSVIADPDNSELESTYYIQDGSIGDSNYAYRSYNAHPAVQAGLNGGTGNIPPGQAFFVGATASGNLILKADHQSVEGEGKLYSSQPTTTLLRLKVFREPDHKADETIISFMPQFSNQADEGVDVEKELNLGYPNIYTALNNQPMAFLGISDNFSSHSEDLYFKCIHDEIYVMEINLDHLPSYWDIQLEDLKEKNTHSLRSSGYLFHHQQTNDPKRFRLHLRKNTFSMPGMNGPKVIVSKKGEDYFANTIEIKIQHEIELYDVKGRLINSWTLAQGKLLNLQSSTLASGVYLLRIRGGGQVYHQSKILK